MQENSANKYASIIGTPEHEKIKKQKQENSANKYASIIGTPEHEKIKQRMQEIVLINMQVLLGHQNTKK